MHNKQLTLEKVANILASWRATKPKPQTRIPEYIKNHIRAISKNYPHQQISRVLNLYGRKLTSILASSEQPSNKPLNFVELPVSAL